MQQLVQSSKPSETVETELLSCGSGTSKLMILGTTFPHSKCTNTKKQMSARLNYVLVDDPYKTEVVSEKMAIVAE